MKKTQILLILTSLLLIVYEVVSAPRSYLSLYDNLYGWAPGSLGLAITPDGKTAYIPFELDDALLVVDLTTFTITHSIDVSAAGNMLFSNTATLIEDGKKLYVSNYATQNVIVVSTDSNVVEDILPLQPLFASAVTTSLNGAKVYISSEDGGLYVVNVSDNSYQRIFVPGICFGPVAPSPTNPDLLYTVGTLWDAGVPNQSFFVFNVASNSVEKFSVLTDEVLPAYTGVRRLVINSNESLAYFGWKGGVDKGIGNFIVFDLANFQVLIVEPVDYGVADFAYNERTGKIYIIGFWAGGGAPGELPILEYDISTNEVVRRIPVSPSSDQRAIAIDPTDANYLYMTEGDANLIRKVEISTGEEISKLQFNKADIRPYAMTLGDDNIGYIRSHYSSAIHKLDLNSGSLIGSFQLPDGISGGAGGGYYQGNLYFSDPQTIYSIDPTDGTIVNSYPVGASITPIQPICFTFYNDKLAFISFKSGCMIGQSLLILNAENMAILESIDLPEEPHGDKVIISPDCSKLYVASGQMGGPTVITIFKASNFDIINTIEVTTSGGTSFIEGDFDETNRILYLTGFNVVYKIDMDADTLIGTLALDDAYESQGRRGWSPCGLCGIVLSDSKDKLFVISGDAHSMFTYDLVNSSWFTEITNLRGYFITDAVCSPDRRYLYTVNEQTDNITMVNLTSGDVEKIIDLDDYDATINQTGDKIPKEYNLSQNYPNPFNTTTNIQFSIPKTLYVKLKIFNMLGKEVATLVDEDLSPGKHKVVFDSKDLPSGLYFYKIQAGRFSRTKKLLLIK